MAGKFGSDVKAFAAKAKLRSLAIFRESTNRVLREASIPEARGGHMPVDTSFLRNSSRAATGGMPSSSSEEPVLVYARMSLGDTVYTGWTAVYALRQEYGFVGEDSLGRSYNQRGKGFMRGAIQQWQQIVTKVAAEVDARYP